MNEVETKLIALVDVYAESRHKNGYLYSVKTATAHKDLIDFIRSLHLDSTQDHAK